MDNNLFTGKLPAEGMPNDALLAFMKAQKSGDADWKAGKMWSLVYYKNEEHAQLVKEAHSLFLSENYLNPMAFKSLKKMEEEVVRMTADMLHGDAETVGCMTSGGTESIFLAVYTAREAMRKRRPLLRKPEIVAPASIHLAFEKAAHYLGIKLIKVPVKEDFRADVEKMAQKINGRTIMLAASAPHYPQGVIDPIEAIGLLAEKHKLFFHVDGCLGGFILPWVEKLGYPIAPFDFRVKGVTSMSADAHKFGYAAKGASVLLHRSMKNMRHQFFISTDWSGGIFVSTGFAGTRSGGAIAAAWAAMKSLGEAGYLDTTRQIMLGAEKLREAIQVIEGFQVLGQPAISITAFHSTDPGLDIYVVADRLEEKGWFVDRQQYPKCIHTTVMPHHLPILDGYIEDLREAAAYARAHPEKATEGQAALYGLMTDLPLRGLVKAQVRGLYEEMYSGGGKSLSLSTGKSTNFDTLEETSDLPEIGKLEKVVLRVLRWLKGKG